MLYDAECQECHYVEEWFCNIAEYEKRKKSYECPNCKEKGTMRSNNFSTAIHFKGLGWTVTTDDRSKKGDAALSTALRENDALTDDFKNNKGIYKKANYLREKAEDTLRKENGE